MMKRTLAIFCAVCLAAGCGQQAGNSLPEAGRQAADNPAASAVPVSGEAEPQAGLPNPVVEYETPDFTESAGFAVSGYPEGEGISLARCALIAGQLAELEFTFDEPGLTATLRVAPEQGEDISGVYGQRYEETVLREMDGVVIEHNASAGGPFLSRWSKGGYAFTLWMEQAPMGMFGGILPRFVAAEATPADPDAAAPVIAAGKIQPDGAGGFQAEIPVDPSDGSDSAALQVAGLPSKPARCWSVAGRVAQLDWEENFGATATLRLAVDDGSEIGGCYYLSPAADYGGETREETVDGIAVSLRDCANGNFRAGWVKDGVRFHLWLPSYDEETLRAFLRVSPAMAETVID